MKSDDLILALINGEDVSKPLISALTAHVYSGESLDCLLKLKANGDGRPSPRRRVLQKLRGESLVAAWEATKNHYEVSDHKACCLLYDFLAGKDTPSPLIEPLLDPIEAYSNMLDIKLGSPTALYNAINNLLFALSK